MSDPLHLRYAPRGAAREIFERRDDEVLLSGPAGTGKSRGAIEKLHLVLLKYPGARGLFLRKTLNSLTSSGLVTYRDEVLHPLDGVTFFSGNRQEPAQYRYPIDATTGRRSVLVVGGLDKPTKVMSSQYDIAYIQEAPECSVNDWESVTTRLRNGVVPYQQIIADANPDAPTHWLKLRCDRGATVMLESRHEDNPRLFDKNGDITPYGQAYMAKLDNLTGVRLQRLRYGRWVAAEGIVYENYNRTIHLVSDLPKGLRYVVGVDWGFTNPGAMTVWGIDRDGRLWLVEEIYRTGKLIDWWAEQGLRIKQKYHPEVWICDPSEPAYIMQFNGKGLFALPAYNEITPGIEASQERLQIAGDGRPRLFIHRDSLKEPDPELVDASQPYRLDQEFDSYVWPKGIDGKPNKEKPIDDANHALDTLRYVVCYVDRIGQKQVAGSRAAAGAPRPQHFQPR